MHAGAWRAAGCRSMCCSAAAAEGGGSGRGSGGGMPMPMPRSSLWWQPPPQISMQRVCPRCLLPVHLLLLAAGVWAHECALPVGWQPLPGQLGGGAAAAVARRAGRPAVRLAAKPPARLRVSGSGEVVNGGLALIYGADFTMVLATLLIPPVSHPAPATSPLPHPHPHLPQLPVRPLEG